MTEQTDLVVQTEQDVLFDRATPAALVKQGEGMARELAGVIDRAKLAVTISGRKYVKVEGWTTLLAMLGVTPREVSVVEEQREDRPWRYTATVELVTAADRVIGRASSECSREESLWSTRDSYALRSMALTRATGKAARLAFSWVMALSGYEVTPAEEMPHAPTSTTTATRPAKTTNDKPQATSGTSEPCISFGKNKGKPQATSGTSEPCITFGKNKGKPVSSLTDRQVDWYVEYMTKRADEGKATDQDMALLEALLHAQNKRNTPEPEPPADDQELPF